MNLGDAEEILRDWQTERPTRTPGEVREAIDVVFEALRELVRIKLEESDEQLKGGR